MQPPLKKLKIMVLVEADIASVIPLDNSQKYQ